MTTSPFLGEYMGTAVLILLGNGAVANVLLKKSKGEGGGWIVISAGWAFAVLCGVLTAIACGSSDAHLNPAVTLGFAVVSGDFAKFVPYVLAQMLGRNHRGDFGLASLPAALERDAGPGSQVGMLFDRACDSQPGGQRAQRDHRNVHPGFRGRSNLLADGRRDRLLAGLRTLPGGMPGMGDRALARRHDRLRHQPGS